MKKYIFLLLGLNFVYFYAFGQGNTCANPEVISALPFTQTGMTTCGFGNDYNSADACSSSYMDGDDYVFAYTPSTNQAISITLSNTDTWTGVFVLDGCPDVGGTNCVASATNSGGNPALCGVNLIAGVTYYIIVSTWPLPQCTPFDIDIRETVPVVTGATCANADIIPSLPFTQTGMTTCCFGDDYSSADACGSSYMNGDDYVFAYTPPTNQNIWIVLSNTNSYTGVFVLDGCPDAGGTNCIASGTTSQGNPTLGCVPLTGGVTYYIVVSTWPSPQCTPFDIQITDASSSLGSLPGDFCDNPAIHLSPGSGYTGSTTGYTDDSPANVEPVFCGSIENNQWFTFTATNTSHSFNIRCDGGPGCTSGIQAEVYEVTTSPGGCCTNFISVSNCWNPSSCTNSTVTATGLTVGNTYYLMIDGFGGDECDFTITNWQGTPTPLMFGNIIGYAAGNENHIKWQTLVEEGAMFFYVERASEYNGIYEILAKVSAFGNSHSLKQYEFIDKNPEAPVHYYRIRGYDNNGNEFVSLAVKVSNGKLSTFSNIYPTIVTREELKIKLGDALVFPVRLEMHSPEGKRIFAKTFDKPGIYTLNTSELRYSGSCIALLYNARSESVLRKFIVVK